MSDSERDPVLRWMRDATFLRAKLRRIEDMGRPWPGERPDWIVERGDEHGPVQVALPMAPDRTRVSFVASDWSDSGSFDLSRVDGTLSLYPASAFVAMVLAHAARTEGPR